MPERINNYVITESQKLQGAVTVDSRSHLCLTAFSCHATVHPAWFPFITPQAVS